MNKIILQNNREISEKARPFFIGEVGINHNGEISIAEKLIDMAAYVGIDSVKFQKRDYINTISPNLLNQTYVHKNSFGSTYLEHKQKLEFSDEQLIYLFEYSKQKKLIPCISGFEIESYKFIEYKLNPLFHKIPSPLVVNHYLLNEVAEYGKPIFLATGMSSEKEIDMAVNLILKKNSNLVLMQCTSLYPTENHEADLLVIKSFKEKYNLITGFSSHDKSVVFPAVAYALGACVFEKHITLDRTMKGPDHSSSFEKRGLELAYNYLISTFEALGDGKKKIQQREFASREKHLQSIVAKHYLKKGEKINFDSITFKSPGNGLLPYEFEKIENKILKVDKNKDELILFEDLE